MGNNSSSAKITQANNQMYVNETNYNIVNKTSNTIINDVVVKNASTCASSSFNFNNITIVVVGAEKLTLDNIKQTQTLKLDFSCQQVQNSYVSIASTLFTKVVSAIEQHNSMDLLTKLNANAEAKLNQGFLGGIGQNKSSSHVDIKNDIKVINKDYYYLENLIYNAMENHINIEQIQECGTNVVNSNNLTIITDGVNEVAVTSFTQEQVVDMMTRCSQMQTTVVEMVNDIATGLDINIVTDKKLQQILDSETGSGSENIMGGIAEAIASVFDGIANVFSSIFGNWLFVVLISCVLLIILLVVGVGGFFVLSDPNMQKKLSSMMNNKLK